MSKETKTVKSIVDAAIAKHSAGVAASAVSKALELKKQQDEEKDSQRILEALGKIEKTTAEAVKALQKARAIEKDTKKFLTEVAEAEQKFIATADFDAYNEAIKVATNKRSLNKAVYSDYCHI